MLLTGASGFIGRACIAPLRARGYDVHTISRGHTELPADVTTHRGDLLDRPSIRQLVADIAPTHLLHAAWDVSHAGYWTSPRNLTWLAASIDLLEVFTSVGGTRAVGVGTCAEYEWNHIPRPGAGVAIVPVTPYGGAKLALCHAFAAAGGLGVETAWGRIFYPYGRGDRPGRLLPLVIAALLEQRRIDCSECLQIRDFMHVDDVGGALAQLLDSRVNGAVDIGTGTGRPIRAIIQEIINQLGHGELVHFGAIPVRATDAPVLVANPQRLTGEVGFTPTVSLAEGVARAIASVRDG
ncbi:MAG: NAD-dependent epimerase/dehydratase family protein [Nevskiales bacterium]